MEIIAQLRQKAKRQLKTIILPEADEERVIKAIKFIEKNKLMNLIVLDRGNLDPKKIDEYTELFFQLRRHKGVSIDEAHRLVSNPVYYAALMVRQGLADGFVAGASHTTPDVAKAAIYCLVTPEARSLVSSCFLMLIPDCSYGERGVFFFADCGIIPAPTSRQLVEIAILTSELADKILNISARIAMLSYSTKGSASGRFVDRIREAIVQLKAMRPNLTVDGELQVDAAIVPEVAKIKNPNSPIQGNANVLIFPSLEAGNISYKLVERLSGARALGPLLLGLSHPCSDLSRGCGWEDVVDCATITAVRAQT